MRLPLFHGAAPEQLALVLPGGVRLHCRPEGRRKTTRDEVIKLEADMGARWAAVLRRLYPGAKRAARVAVAFGCEVDTAAKWLAGQRPAAKALARLWRLHGAAAAAEVLAPESALAQLAGVDAAMAELEHRAALVGDLLVTLKVTA